MKKIYAFVIIVILIWSCTSKVKTIEFFVSEGTTNVKNNGTKQQPFESINDAIEKVNQLKQENSYTRVIVNILPGNYNLSEPITITPQLSGLEIKGTSASEVVLKGSKTIQSNWKKYNEAIFVTDVEANSDFDQLVINGTAQVLARYPNYNEKAQYWQGYAADAISPERIATWKKPKGGYFNALHQGKWGGFHYKITGVNEDGTAKLEGGFQNNRPSIPHKKYRMVENIFEELDTVNEWYLDKVNSKLYFYPSENIDLNTAAVEVSVTKDLIQVVGTLENPVKDVKISNLTFKNTKRTFMEEFEPLLRSDWTIYRGGVVFFEGTENCTIQDSEFTNLGGNVIMVSKYNKELTIKGNHIYNCGASAVSFVGDASAVRSPSFTYKEYVKEEDLDTIRGPKNELYPRGCKVDDNLIYRIGRIEKQTAGVQISMAMEITVSNNSIYDVPRAGINVSEGTWGGHVIEYNDVFNTVLETSDHGSFNSWGRDRFWLPNRKAMNQLTARIPNMYTWDAIKTTIIRNNRFRCDHGWDIDLDDGSSNYHIYNNLLLNNGLKLREGFARVAENNIMVNNSLHPHIWFKNSRDVIKYNILGDTYQDVNLQGWGKEMDYNLFINEADLLKAQIYNIDEHSIVGDPMFKNPTTLDFSVQENSPAFKIGFKNFAMNLFGVKKEALKAIAKTPKIPELKNSTDEKDKSSPTVAWWRNELKSVASEQEQSAYGLNTAEGVIIVKVWKSGAPYKNNGIRQGDVIIEAEGKKIKTISDFLKIVKQQQISGKMKLVVMRNQSEVALNINIK